MKSPRQCFFSSVKAILVCLAGAGVLRQINAAQPDWVTGLGTSASFPESRYLTGFGASGARDDASISQAVEEAKSNAARDLAEAMKVRVQVRVTNGTIANTRAGNSGKSKELRDDYWSQIVSTSDVDVEGLGFEVYQQSARQPVYALAWIDKDRLRKHYRQKLASRMQLASELNKRVDGMSAQGDIVGARELSEESQNVLDEIDGITAMLELLGDVPDAKALATEKADVLGRIPDLEGNAPLRLVLWTSTGAASVTLMPGEAMAVFARVNRPCYLHLVCRLSVGAWILPDARYWNLRLDESKTGRDYVLPDSFFATRPAGTDTLVAVASLEKWPECDYARQLISGEEYRVIAQSCVPARALFARATPDSASVKHIVVTTKE